MKKNNSKVYELTAPRKLALKEVSIDMKASDGDSIFAETLFSAISPGTELAAWKGKPPLRPSKVYPRLLGYCNVAKVKSVGENITDIDKGDIILTHQSHRDSFFCKREDVLLKDRNLDSNTLRNMTTTYLYHLGYSALFDGGYKPGIEVAVIGLGALGYTTADLISACGGTPMVFSGRKEITKIEKVLQYANFFNKNTCDQIVNSVAGLDGADLIVNTSDSWEDYKLSLKIVRKGGTVVLLGFPGRGVASPNFNPLDSQYIYDKSITIKQVGHCFELDVQPIDIRFTLKRNLSYIYSLLKSGRLNPNLLVQSVYPWNNLEDAYKMLELRPQDSLSAILDWTC